MKKLAILIAGLGWVTQLMANGHFCRIPERMQYTQGIKAAKSPLLQTDFVPLSFDAPAAKKLWRGSCWVYGYNTIAVSLLIALPQKTTLWNLQDVKSVKPQYKRTFTTPPVLDGDHWYINYVGHPYQGSCYYNALRSQGAKWWQAGLFCAGHSLLWEYVVEGGMEQPSVQDMLVTPIGGSLLGELIHFSTMRMSRNGFKWYEKVFVCVFNPMFALNNGFKTNR